MINVSKVLSQFSSDITELEARFFKKVEKLVNQKGISDFELANMIYEHNFYAELRNLGLDGAYSELLDKYDETLAYWVKEGRARGVDIMKANVQMLDDLADIDAKAILRRAEMFDSQFKSALLKPLISGYSQQQLIDEFLPVIQKEVPFKTNWFIAAVDSAFTSFHSTTIKKVFEDDPEQRFTLLHPLDKNTRERCLHAIKISDENPDGFTIEEIEGGALGLEYRWDTLGGFNCRGQWVMAEVSKSYGAKLDKQKTEAKKRFANKKEAEEYAKRFSDGKVKLGNLDEDLTNSLINTLENLGVGQNIPKFREIIVKDLKTDAFANTHLATNHLHINSRFNTRSKYGEMRNKEKVAREYLANQLDKITDEGKREKVKELLSYDRSLIDDSFEGAITHETGHHIDFMLMMPRDIDLRKQIMSNKKNYVESLSSYATKDNFEYFAESYTAWRKKEPIDPVLKKYFEKLYK